MELRLVRCDQPDLLHPLESWVNTLGQTIDKLRDEREERTMPIGQARSSMVERKLQEIQPRLR